jgi:hypothetical protein
MPKTMCYNKMRLVNSPDSAYIQVTDENKTLVFSKTGEFIGWYDNEYNSRILYVPIEIIQAKIYDLRHAVVVLGLADYATVLTYPFIGD